MPNLFSPPKEGLPTSTSSEHPQWSLPTSARLMPYGLPVCQHRHCHRRRDKIIAATSKTSSPTSGPSMPYGRPFCQHRHRHCRREKIIAGTRKTSSPTSGPRWRTVSLFATLSLSEARSRKWESASECTKDPTDIRPDDVAHRKRKSASECTKDSTDRCQDAPLRSTTSTTAPYQLNSV